MNKTGIVKTLVGKVKIELVDFEARNIIKNALVKDFELIIKPVISSRDVVAEEIELYRIEEVRHE